MFKILKVKGDSMYPLLKQGDKVLCLKKNFVQLRLGDYVVFNHQVEGLMVKELKKINSEGYYVKGTSAYSIDSSIFGYLQKKDILYKVIYKF